MRDEASYVEFVSARWAALYRLAFLLAGSQHAAEDLLQTSLLRAHMSWDKVRRTESPEAYVRRIVVSAAISDGRRRSRRPEVVVGALPEIFGTDAGGELADRADLWPLVAALPPRQRAVVVLRYYEDLSEADIARVLGCARGTVKSQASAALTSLRVAIAAQPRARMSQVDETVLCDMLRARSDTPVPPAPVDDLLAGGRAVVRRRRTRFAVGAGLAAAVLLVGGVLVAQPHDAKSLDPVDRTPTPTPMEELRLLRDVPRGALPAVPFAEKGTLYLNGGTVETRSRGLDLAVGGGMIVSRTYPTKNGEPAPIDLLDPTTGQPVRRIADDGGRPAVSADGRLVAWEDDNPDGTAGVRLWDVEDGGELDPISFPFTPSCCDNPFVLIGIDADGTVYGSGGGTTWVATPGDEPRLVEGLGGPFDASISDIGVDRLVVTDGSTSRVGHFDGIRFRTEFRVWGLGATLSSDEARLAYVDDDDVVRVRDVESGDELEMRLPTNVVVNGPLTWETYDDLLVQVQAESGEADGNAWLRCAVETGTCELATTFRNELPTLPHR